MLNYIVIISFILAILTYAFILYRKGYLKVHWDKFSQFFAFMCFILMVRTAFTGANNPSLGSAPAFFLNFVWWEDLVFMTPMYFAFEKFGKNRYTIGLAVALSLTFASGHLYHGYLGALSSALIPYFIMYNYAKRTSIGTVMVCHVLYDLMLFYSVRILA